MKKIIVLIAVALAGCASANKINLAYKCNPKLSNSAIKKYLKQKNVYNGYNMNKITITEHAVNNCVGLFFISMPSKKSIFNVNIPMLVDKDKFLLNYYSFTFQAR